MSLSLIIEEGFSISMLNSVLQSVASAAQRTGIEVVTGDTKVVPRGCADGLFLNTTGIGFMSGNLPTGPSSMVPGDVIIVSGPIARHGIAVLAAREELRFEPVPQSDCAPLCGLTQALQSTDIPIRAMRDATRGGLCAVLHEWSAQSGRTLRIDENQIPVTKDVFSICELLGLDPLYVANEGTMLIVVAQGFADQALFSLRNQPEGKDARVIGEVVPRGLAPVVIKRSLGREMPLDEPHGNPLPRIC